MTRRGRRQRPVGLSPAAAPTLNSKSVAISTSYPNLSTFRFPPKAARAAGYLPNDRRLISADARLRHAQYSPLTNTSIRASRRVYSSQETGRRRCGSGDYGQARKGERRGRPEERRAGEAGIILESFKSFKPFNTFKSSRRICYGRLRRLVHQPQSGRARRQSLTRSPADLSKRPA